MQTRIKKCNKWLMCIEIGEKDDFFPVENINILIIWAEILNE